jgi:hypothetical protein
VKDQDIRQIVLSLHAAWKAQGIVDGDLDLRPRKRIIVVDAMSLADVSVKRILKKLLDGNHSDEIEEQHKINVVVIPFAGVNLDEHSDLFKHPSYREYVSKLDNVELQKAEDFELNLIQRELFSMGYSYDYLSVLTSQEAILRKLGGILVKGAEEVLKILDSLQLNQDGSISRDQIIDPDAQPQMPDHRQIRFFVISA